MYHVSSRQLIGLSAVGCLFGFVALVEWIPNWSVRNVPIVTGHIIDRQLIGQLGRQRVEFTIRVEKDGIADENGDIVHARAHGYLMTKVPDQVRFRYSGDPTREVFLFEHQEDPFWTMLFVWSVSILLLAIVLFRFANASAPPPTKL